jgi:hypothetical protein
MVEAQMDRQIESFARVFGVPSEVLDVIGRDFVSKLVEEMPVLLLPAFMSNLKRMIDENGLDWTKRNVSHLKEYFLQLRQISGPVTDTGSGYMEILIESAAEKYRVSREIVSLVGIEFISQLITEFPNLLLSPVMQTLKHEQVQHGMDWFRQNVASIREELLLLKRLYGPTWILA